jgi:hypothetical protein
MPDYPKLLEKLGPDGLDELRRLIAEEVARRPDRRAGAPPSPLPTDPKTTPGPDDDLRPRG